MKGLIRKESGFSLIEVLVGLAIIGIIVAGFLLAIAGAYKANILADEQATAESIARSQLEYIKEQVYLPWPPDGLGYDMITIDQVDFPGYSLWSWDWDGAANEEENWLMIEDMIGVPWDSQNDIPISTDTGQQKIRLVVKHNGEKVLEIDVYKVARPV